jgi:hypothetical protein
VEVAREFNGILPTGFENDSWAHGKLISATGGDLVLKMHLAGLAVSASD